VARGQAALAELLVEHGVPERGARLYLAACREGPSTVSELARSSGLHRVEAYRFIRDLATTGLLQPTGGRPMRFVALPLDQLVDRWIRHTADKLERLQGDREKLLDVWRAGLQEPDPHDPRKFAVLEGRSLIRRFLEKRFDQAEKEVLLTVSGFALIPAIDGGLDRPLGAARSRGVRVRMVTEVTGANRLEARHFATVSELRHSPTPVTNRAIVIDRAGALVYVSGEEGLGQSGEDQVALWSTAPSVLALARTYHQRVWARGVPFEQRLVQLENPSTPVLAVVQGKEPVAFQRLREVTELGMRATGLKSVDFSVPEMIESVGRQMGREIAGQVEGQSPEEVAESLSRFYAQKALGRLEMARPKPLTLRVTGCFACTPEWTEIGRVLCPKILQTVLEQRLGEGWAVSSPDPRRHAAKGCLFNATQV